MAPHRKLLLPCTCAGCCAVMGVDDWGDYLSYPDDPYQWTVEFYSRSGSAKGTRWYRVKKAWNVLWGRDHFFDCIALDGDGLRQLREFIDLNPPLPLINTVNTDTNWTGHVVTPPGNTA